MPVVNEAEVEMATEQRIRGLVTDYMRSTGVSAENVRDFEQDIAVVNICGAYNTVKNQPIVKTSGIPNSEILYKLLSRGVDVPTAINIVR